MNLSNYDVTELLKEWGAWSCSGLGKASLETPAYDNSHWINDDIGLFIDKAVIQLKKADIAKAELDKVRKYKKHYPRYHAVILHYKDRYNIPMLANSLKCGQAKATLILRSGESFIESRLGLLDFA